ncbi:polysaccharide pyruvyl transferase family protein [Xanthobacter sp. VNH20]|uniref:polysaccharide pyruvyl transferase family protein n=1 Tax=Xanthobacter sp. VNH20 TaxID=3156616 RepID=UPI0032B585EF
MRVFLLGATPSFNMDAVSTPSERLAATGGNSGNQVIAYGLLRELSYSSVSWDYSIGTDRVNAEYDVIVIAAANFLFPAFDFAGMAAFIERTNLPCVMVGVGAQSNTFSPDIELKPGTKRLMEIVSERSKLIGVRGPFSAEVLEHIGITNVQVTGCPSYYMSCKPELKIAKPALPQTPRMAINLSRDVLKHSFDADQMRKVIRQIASEAVRYGADFIAQTEMDEIILTESPGTPEADAALERAYGFFSGIADEPALREWLRTHMRVYWSVDDWIREVKTCDFVFGQRFHGNMIAIQSGVPAMFVCHDSRTTEMCSFLGLPYVSLKELDTVNARELYEKADFAPLAQRYAELYPAYRTFLETNKLPHKLGSSVSGKVAAEIS